MPAAARTRPLRHRTVALAMVLAAGSGAGIAACGGSSGGLPSVSAIAGKLTGDADFKGANQATITCIAGVLRQYASAASLKSYVKSGNTDDLDGTDANETKAEAGTKACVAKYQTAG